MPIGSSKIGVLGAGLVPGGSVTFNATGTWPIPPGVKKVSITGKGGTGNPGVAGNAGNPGNPGSGGGGAGSSGSSWRCTGCCINPQPRPGAPGGIAFKPGILPIICSGPQIFPPTGWAPPSWYSDPANRCVYAMPISQGAGTSCPYVPAVRPATNSTVGFNGCGGASGNAGTVGQAGTAGNNGQPSSGLGNTFPGGAGGNAPVGGTAGNSGTAGSGGSTGPGNTGGAGGNGGGSGGNSSPTPGSFSQNAGVNQQFARGAAGGGGAGSVNDGTSGANIELAPAPRSPPGIPQVNINSLIGLGGTDPQMSSPIGASGSQGVPSNYQSTISLVTMGGNGGSGLQVGATMAIFGRFNSPTALSPFARNSAQNWNPAPLRPSLVRAGGGGGGVPLASLTNCGTTVVLASGAGGGGRGNAGNAGGNSPTVSGQAATPSTFNCVPVTPGGTTPITVGTPGGQVVISWNPQ